MRVAFSEAVCDLAERYPELIFLSGDLGFNALERVAGLMGPRFINTGVTEQSSVDLAAGLAYRGHKVIFYSIAPFAAFRPLEQIRLAVGLHNLPVFVVGNGGGFGYGIMGATHHALEDLACLSCLPNLRAYIPAFDDEVAPTLEEILQRNRPAYLRLGLGPKRQQFPPPGDLQRYREGQALTAVALGPLVHNLLAAAEGLDVDVWTATRLPLEGDFSNFYASLRQSRGLLVAEEHVARGGLAETLSLKILEAGLAPAQFRHCAVRGYPGGVYGSQNFHRQANGLDVGSIRKRLEEMLA